ncbi:MAG: hypothetical protein ACKN81_07710 [Pirellulaceae bacterium]|jgi:hypothetical protein
MTTSRNPAVFPWDTPRQSCFPNPLAVWARIGLDSLPAAVWLHQLHDAARKLGRSLESPAWTGHDAMLHEISDRHLSGCIRQIDSNRLAETLDGFDQLQRRRPGILLTAYLDPAQAMRLRTSYPLWRAWLAEAGVRRVCVGISSIRQAAFQLIRVGSTVQQEIDPILLTAQPHLEDARSALESMADGIGVEEQLPDTGTD